MSENEHHHSLLEEQEIKNANLNRKPYWKTIHHHWYFWVFLVLTLSAVLYYIMTEDFSFAPRTHSKQPTENQRVP